MVNVDWILPTFDWILLKEELGLSLAMTFFFSVKVRGRLSYTSVFFFLLHVFSKLSPQKCWCISSDLWCAAEVYQRAVFQEKGITGSHRNSELFYGSRPPTKHGHDSDLHSALHLVSLSWGLAKPCSLTRGTVTSQVVTMIHCIADRRARSRKAVMTSHPDREAYVFLMGWSLKFCSDSCPPAGS